MQKNLNQLKIKIDNIKKEQLEVEREGATIEQSMKQRDIRFFGGSQTATDAELIQKTLGGPFAVGHVMELNRLNEPLIQEQKQKKFLTEKAKKVKIMREVKNLSETFQQERVSSKFLDRYSKANFVGKTNKKNLVFEVNGKQYKITPHGAIL